MNKIYFGIPLVALALFWGYNQFVFQPENHAKEQAKEQAIKDADAAKRAKDKADQEVALADSRRLADERGKQRKLDEAKKEATIAKRAQEAQDLEDAKTDRIRMRDEVRDVEKDVYAEKQLLQVIETQKKTYEAEKTFLIAYTQTVRNNSKRFEGLIDKIELSEKARADAAIAAAAAAPKK